MSENGPYNQPPQNPYGGGDGTGGQPPYGPPQGGPYGDPGTGGQPGYGQAPYQGGPGAPGQDQGMYSGGQPPYGPGPGGPGGPGGYPPAQPPQGGGGSKAGLWVVISGGVVIVVLVIAVVIMLVTNGNDGNEVAAEPDGTSEVTEEEPEEGTGGATEEEPEEEPAGSGELGEPPHSLPVEPCEVFTEDVQADFNLRGDGSKYVSDNRASCSSSGDAPDNPEGTTGYLDVAFKVPMSATDAPEAASTDIEYTLERIRGESTSEMYDAEDIEEDKEIAGLGDESYFVVTKYESLDMKVPEALLVIRQDNLIIEVTYDLNNFRDEDADLALPDDVADIMVNAVNVALGVAATA